MNLLDIVIQHIEALLMGEIPQFISHDGSDEIRVVELAEKVNKLITAVSEIHNFVLPLSKGELQDIKISRMNLMGSPFKELHSKLLNLTWQAGQIADGDYSQRIDFMGEFSRSFNSMVEALDLKDRSLKAKIDELESKNRLIDMELDIARTIQNNLIPASMPEFPGVELCSIYKPMDQVGGDLFDFITFHEENKIGIFISDVSGHGVPAALIASMVKTLCTTAGEARNSSSGFLQFINNGLVGLSGDNFLTAFYGIYDSFSQVFSYSRCGHCFPLLLREGGIWEIKSSGTIMGIMNDIQIEEREIKLEKGDKIIFYTDGLTEASDSRKIQFEEIMVQKVIPEISHLPVADLLERLYKSMFDFAGGIPPDDDVCIVGMEIV